MFHYDRGIILTRAHLALDVRRRQKLGFISHAHTDHMGKHELALCTPETARLYQFRCGMREVLQMPYRETLELDGLELTTYPAGHCLGSAMLLARDGDQSLLYTGDFKLGESATSERAELPQADILVLESTYGKPQYRLPPRQEVLNQLYQLVEDALNDDCTPVIHAYALGKGQEVTRLLTDRGIPVLQHQKVYEISQIYQQCGCDLGDYGLFSGSVLPGHAVIVPPGFHRGQSLSRIKRSVSIAVTGWAIDEGSKYRFGVDHMVPLSDHADFDELFETIERVSPSEIYCTHGPESFVDHLREAGLNAFTLSGTAQKRLF